MRTFVALELPEKAKSQLKILSKKLQAHNIRGIKWVLPENYHFTLTFIGDISSNQQKEVMKLIEDHFSELSCPEFSEPALKLIPAGFPRILWVEYKCSNTTLAGMNRRFRNDLTQMGLKIDKKPLKFHVTLARIKGQLPSEFVEQVLNTKIPSLPFKCDNLTFYQSVLKPEGPVYSSLAEFRLI